MLYVGKAKDLAKRIAQYRQGREISPHKQLLVREAVKVKYQLLASELEALLVEAELVHRYQPRFNILLKDDKSPIYVVITREDWPRVLTARQREIAKGKFKGDIYGPFSSAYTLHKVLRTIRPIFRWCNRVRPRPGSDPGLGLTPRPCFYYHLNLCSGACLGLITAAQYRADIVRLRQFLRGRVGLVLRQLKKEITAKANVQKFEEAAGLREQYQAIQQITDPAYRWEPDVALPRLRSEFGLQGVRLLREMIAQDLELGESWQPRRIECYDVSNLQGKLATVSLVTFIDGVADPSEYRIFHVRNLDTPDDYAMLRQVLRRRQNHPEWGIPDLVLIDGGRGQLNAVQTVWRWPRPVVGIAKRPDRLVIRQTDGHFIFHPVDQLSLAGELLQQLRDEAHRFAKKHVHRRLAKRDLTR